MRALLKLMAWDSFSPHDSVLYSEKYCAVFNGMTSGLIRSGWILDSCHTTCMSNQHRVGANHLVPQFCLSEIVSEGE